MAANNVADFAAELKITSTHLLEQLKAAGVTKTREADPLTEHDKEQLLQHLQRAHGSRDQKTKITLVRKQTTEIKTADAATGRARTIQVEVKKKRTFVKNDAGKPVGEPEAVEAAVAAPIPTPAPAPAPASVPAQAAVAPPAPVVAPVPEPLAAPEPTPAPVAAAPEPEPA
ncbi:MAG: translation initiation factor IF-2 associated domain-containing protein, partial [Pseudomonadota bacterium]|nr:translation initiation factor IF-2 associated domain-containing protein [Pseudomonadota bacterium]